MIKLLFRRPSVHFTANGPVDPAAPAECMCVITGIKTLFTASLCPPSSPSTTTDIQLLYMLFKMIFF